MLGPAQVGDAQHCVQAAAIPSLFGIFGSCFAGLQATVWIRFAIVLSAIEPASLRRTP